MAKLRRDTAYSVETLPAAGALRISTKNAAAESATHEYLRFQIREHKPQIKVDRS